MQIFGICTKPLSEVCLKLQSLDIDYKVLKRHTKKSELPDTEVVICPDYMIFNSWYKELDDKKVVVLGNPLFLSEIVHITFLDIKIDNGFRSKYCDYNLLLDNDNKVNLKKLSHLKYTARLLDTNVKDKFFRQLDSLLLNTSVGEHRNDVLRLVYSCLFGTQKIGKLYKDLQPYFINEIDNKILDTFYKFIKNKEFLSICKQLINQKTSGGINYDKLEGPLVSKKGLKTMMKDYSMLQNAKQNMTPLDIYNSLAKSKLVEESEED